MTRRKTSSKATCKKYGKYIVGIYIFLAVFGIGMIVYFAYFLLVGNLIGDIFIEMLDFTGYSSAVNLIGFIMLIIFITLTIFFLIMARKSYKCYQKI